MNVYENISSFYFCTFLFISDERDAIQKKTFTKWANKHLKKVRRIFFLLLIRLNSSFVWFHWWRNLKRKSNRWRATDFVQNQKCWFPSSYETFHTFYSNFELQKFTLCSFKNHEFILQKREIKVRNTQNGFVKPKWFFFLFVLMSSGSTCVLIILYSYKMQCRSVSFLYYTQLY